MNGDQAAVKTTGQASNAAQNTGTAAGTADVLPAAMRSSFAVGVRSVSSLSYNKGPEIGVWTKPGPRPMGYLQRNEK